jgi:hypothetical protein
MTEEKNNTEIVPTEKRKSMSLGGRGIELATFNDLWNFAGVAVKSRLVPASITTVEQVTLIIQAGMELGLGPMAALQNMYIVNNRPTLYGEIGIGLCRASGLMTAFDQGFTGAFPDPTFTAWCEVVRLGEKPLRKEFSIADAKYAGLWDTNNWKKYPKDMLMWKATWRALRSGFADILKGVQGYEDMDQVVDAQSFETVKQAEPRKRSDQLADALEAGSNAISHEPELELTGEAK